MYNLYISITVLLSETSIQSVWGKVKLPENLSSLNTKNGSKFNLSLLNFIKTAKLEDQKITKLRKKRKLRIKMS